MTRVEKADKKTYSYLLPNPRLHNLQLQDVEDDGDQHIIIHLLSNESWRWTEAKRISESALTIK